MGRIFLISKKVKRSDLTLGRCGFEARHLHQGHFDCIFFCNSFSLLSLHQAIPPKSPADKKFAVKFPSASPRIAVSFGKTQRLKTAAKVVAHKREVPLIQSGVIVSSFAKKNRAKMGIMQAAGREITVQKNTVPVRSRAIASRLKTR